MQSSVPLHPYSLFWHTLVADSVPTSMFPHTALLLTWRFEIFGCRNKSVKLKIIIEASYICFPIQIAKQGFLLLVFYALRTLSGENLWFPNSKIKTQGIHSLKVQLIQKKKNCLHPNVDSTLEGPCESSNQSREPENNSVYNYEIPLSHPMVSWNFNWASHRWLLITSSYHHFLPSISTFFNTPGVMYWLYTLYIVDLIVFQWFVMFISTFVLKIFIYGILLISFI